MSGSGALFLGIDLGTTEVKVGLVTLDGEVKAIARASYPLDTSGGSGWAEQDPEAWWSGVVAATRSASAQAGSEIAAICCSGQGPTLVPTSREGEPVGAAITWLDTRARPERAEIGGAIPIEAGVAGILPNALWIERHRPDPRIAWYLNSWEFVTLRLSGRAATSLTEGQAPLATERLRGTGIDPGRLPDTVRAGSVVGGLLSAAGEQLGLPAGIPVVTGMNDGFVSFLGAGLLEAGEAIDTGGTSGGFGVYWDQPTTIPGTYTGPAPLPNRYILGGAMSTTGKALDWLCESIVGAPDVEHLLAEATTVEPAANGLVFLPYLAGERSPIWDPQARGAFVGLTLVHRRAHLTRAVLEAAALAIRQVAEPILDAGLTVTEMRVCGGTARSELWNQIKADVTGFPVAVPEARETVVLGGAILAAVAIGAVPDLEAGIRRMVRIERRIEPRPEARPSYDALYTTYKELYPRLVPTFRQLAALDDRAAAATLT